MDINFVEDGNKYVAEIQVTADFNLHIEREERGFIFVEQKTVEDGAYDSIKGLNMTYVDPVIDMDFTGVIYPKWIRIVSKVMPTKAVLTTNEA